MCGGRSTLSTRCENKQVHCGANFCDGAVVLLE